MTSLLTTTAQLGIPGTGIDNTDSGEPIMDYGKCVTASIDRAG